MNIATTKAEFLSFSKGETIFDEGDAPYPFEYKETLCQEEDECGEYGWRILLGDGIQMELTPDYEGDETSLTITFPDGTLEIFILD